MTTISEVAQQADTILEEVMKVEPMIAAVAGTFVPAIAVIQPEIVALLPVLDKALQAVAEGNGGNVVDAIAQIAKHLLPGLPNAPALSPEAHMTEAT